MNQLENAILFVRDTRHRPESETGERDAHGNLKVPTMKTEV
jgi:hypothetical protein